MSTGVAPEVIPRKPQDPGGKTHDRRIYHDYETIGVSVLPQEGLMSSKNYLKKKENYFQGLILKRHLLYAQVTIHINEIPSRCDGDCSFQYMDGDTPRISGIKPAEGNDTDCLFTLHDTVSGTAWGGAMQKTVLAK